MEKIYKEKTITTKKKHDGRANLYLNKAGIHTYRPWADVKKTVVQITDKKQYTNFRELTWTQYKNGTQIKFTDDGIPIPPNFEMIGQCEIVYIVEVHTHEAKHTRILAEKISPRTVRRAAEHNVQLPVDINGYMHFQRDIAQYKKIKKNVKKRKIFNSFSDAMNFMESVRKVRRIQIVSPPRRIGWVADEIPRCLKRAYNNETNSDEILAIFDHGVRTLAICNHNGSTANRLRHAKNMTAAEQQEIKDRKKAESLQILKNL